MLSGFMYMDIFHTSGEYFCGKSIPKAMKDIHILIVVLLILFSCCKKDIPSISSKNDIPNNPSSYDYSYVNRYRNDFNPNIYFQIIENKYSRLLMKPSSFSDEEIKKISANIDTVINRICVYLDTDIEKEYSGFKGKVSYFVEPEILPRAYGGSPIPIVSITNDVALLSMYAHETVHIFSMKTSSLWLIEGLAVHLADTLGVEDLWPNYSENLHKHAKRFISNQEALNFIGVKGFFWLDPTTNTGEAFYTLSGSFVRYLTQHLGKADFKNCYSSNDFDLTISNTTNKTFDVWKEEWIMYLVDLKM